MKLDLKTKYIALLLVVGAVVGARGEIRNLYLDSSNPAAGDGSLTNPYRAFSSIKWSIVQSWANAGDDVRISFKRGSLFRDSMTISATGSAAKRILFCDYGAGDKPIISGETGYAGWTASALGGGIWQVPANSAPARLWVGDALSNKASGAGAMLDGMWYWNSSVLYFRSDRGNPDTLRLAMTGSTRANNIVGSSPAFLSFTNLVFVKSASYAVRFSGGHDLSFDDCEWRDSDGSLYLDSTTAVIAKSCSFKRIYGNQTALVQGIQSAASFYFCFFNDQFVSYVFNVTSSAAINFVNCNFIGQGSSSINNTGTGVVNVVNCIFSGNGIVTNTAGLAPLIGLGTNLYVRNTLIVPNGNNQQKNHLNNITEIGRNYYVDPRYMSVNSEAVLSLITDDYENTDDWITYANLAAERGFPATLALSKTDLLTSADRQKIQTMIDKGHSVVSHTRSHADLTKPSGIYLQYVGAGTACEVTVSSNHLKTTVTGGPGGENLDINLLDAKYNITSSLQSYLDGLPAYACRLYTVYNHQVPSRLLMETNALSIKTEMPLAYERGAFYTNEIYLSRLDVQGQFHTSNGGPYETRAFVYPGGYADDTVVNEAIKAGYYAGRSTTPAPYATHLERVDLFQLPVPSNDSYGYFLRMDFEGNALDTSPAPSAFTAKNLAFTAPAFKGNYAGNFNGTNSYITKSASVEFDFSRGYWDVSGSINPRNSGSRRTLFAITNAGTGLRITLEPNRSLSVSSINNGTEQVIISTPPASVANGSYLKFAVEQRGNLWWIRINDTLRGAVTNQTRFAAGTIFIGSVGADDFYDGFMDDLIVCNGTYFKTQAMLDMLCQFGGGIPQITHGESGMPREILRIFLDAIKDYTGRVKVLGFDDYVKYIRSNGYIAPDGRTLIYTNLIRAANYHLRGDSPCVGQGDLSAVAGVPGLHDLEGIPVTDSAGNVILDHAGIDIGAYIYTPPSNPTLSIESSPSAPPAKVKLHGVNGGYYQVQQSANLQTWTPLTNVVDWDDSAIPVGPKNGANNIFYRAVVIQAGP